MLNKLLIIIHIIFASLFAPIFAVFKRIEWRNNNFLGLLYNFFLLVLFVISSPFLFIIGLFLPVFIFNKLKEKINESSSDSKRNICLNNIEIIKSVDLLVTAKRKYNSNRHNEALTDLDIIIAKSELDFEAFLYRGMTLQKLGFFIDSISDFDKAISKKPNEANLYFLRASSKLQIQELYSAQEDIKMAIQLNPKIDEYAHYLKMVNILMEDKEMQETFKQEAFVNGKFKLRKQ